MAQVLSSDVPRVVFPISSGGIAVKPGANLLIEVDIRKEGSAGFAPDRLFVSSAGTERGADDWQILDILIDGKTVLRSPGEIEGGEFSTSRIDSDYPGIRWRQCRESIGMRVRYVGENADGCPFYASAIGYP